MVNDLPREKLREIVALYGRSIADSADKCEAVLRDCCSGYRREIHGLIIAIKERVVTDLLASPTGSVSAALMAELSKRLEDNGGLEKDLARWVVESWALALDKLSPGDVQQIEAITSPLQQSSPSYPQPPAGGKPQQNSRAKLAAGVLATLLLGGGGVFGYQRWMEKIEAQKAEEEAIRQAEQARKTAQEQVRQAALKADQERRELEAKQEQEHQQKATEQKQRALLRQQSLEQTRLENQRRQLEIQERQERVRSENQQRQQESRERQEQVRLESQRRQQELREKQQQAQIEARQKQQELRDKQRELQLQRQKEAQERATQQQQQRAVEDILKGVLRK